jgi:hypothetical protein
MATFLFILQLLIVLSMIFVGARVGGIGLGIYGMVGGQCADICAENNHDYDDAGKEQMRHL